MRNSLAGGEAMSELIITRYREIGNRIRVTPMCAKIGKRGQTEKRVIMVMKTQPPFRGQRKRI